LTNCWRREPIAQIRWVDEEGKVQVTQEEPKPENLTPLRRNYLPEMDKPKGWRADGRMIPCLVSVPRPSQPGKRFRSPP
jgi:hypothetical protein